MRVIPWEEFRKIDFNRTASAVTYNFEILSMSEDEWIFNRTTAGITDAFGELTSTEPGDIHLDGISVIPLNFEAFLTSIDINSNLTVRIIYTPVFTPFNFTTPTLAVDVTINQTNPDIVDFLFTRTDINTTQSLLDVTFPVTYDTECTFYYSFAQDSDTYTNLATVDIGDGQTTATFEFNNVGNDVIDVECVDTNTNHTGRYIITQTQFELLNVFNNFRSGEYGTFGMFGVIDFITLIAMIMAMIGFNRSNPTVGVIIAVFIMGGLSFFGIINLTTIIFGALAVIVMLVVASTTKK